MLFARTPPEVELSGAPFLYLTQYRYATELMSVPFAEVRRVADASPVPSERIVQVHSTGRCGSTLVSNAAAADDVISLSEPDVYYQLHQLRDGGDPEFEALLKSCTTLLCAPRPARTWAIKFRSMNIELAEPLSRCFPTAKMVFLYRQAGSWARSAARAYGIFRPEVIANWDRIYEALPRLRTLVDAPILCSWPSPAEMLSWTWCTSMVRAVALLESGVLMFPCPL